MEIKVSDEKGGFKLQVMSGNQALLRAIQGVILAKGEMETAIVSVDHPLTGNPYIIVKGKDAKSALKDAIKELKREFTSLESALEKK
jgi:DNA-directed RNA polymerase subunit L